MKEEDKEKILKAYDTKKKVRLKNKKGDWSDAGIIAAGLGRDLPQDGVRIEVLDHMNNKIKDIFFIWEDVEQVEIIE